MQCPICVSDICEAMLLTMTTKLCGNEADRHTFFLSFWALRCALCMQQASLMKAMGQPVGRQVGGRFTGGLLTFQYEEQDIGQEMVVYKPAALSNPERRPALIVSVGVLGYAWGLLTPVVFQVCLPAPFPLPSAPIVQPPFHPPSAIHSHCPSCYAPLSPHPLSIRLTWPTTQAWETHVSLPTYHSGRNEKSKSDQSFTHIVQKQKCAVHEHFAVKRMLLIRGISCHVVVCHSVVCQHVLCLQGVLSDPHMSLTPPQAAGDPKRTRAYEGHVPRLSLLSWCASSSPTQDWMAYVAHPSLPGNERTPSLCPSPPTPPFMTQLLVCPLASLPMPLPPVQLCLTSCRPIAFGSFLFLPESDQHSNQCNVVTQCRRLCNLGGHRHSWLIEVCAVLVKLVAMLQHTQYSCA